MITMDEKLSAYLDNMLPEVERASLESLLAASPELAARLEALALANTDFIARAAEIDRIPMSDGLRIQLESLQAAAGSAAENVTDFRPRKALNRFFNDHRAMAACAALAAGFFTWQLVLPGPDLAPSDAVSPGGLIIAVSPLGQMFAASPSETAVRLGEGEEGRVRFSFASEDGGWCRLADIEAPDGTSRLVACQSSDDWRIVIAAYTGPAGDPGTDVYRTASTEAAASVEALLDTLMAGAPLSQEEEKALIETGWTRP
jgi:hypothetical protein